MLRLGLIPAALAALLLLFAAAACDDDDDAAPTPTAAPSDTPAAAGPAAPGDVTLSGPLPDLNTPVPPGGGELGRLTVAWQDNSDDEDGFRIYQECGGAPAVLVEVAADTTSYGPLQTCRPGRLGVAAYNAAGESAIAWAD